MARENRSELCRALAAASAALLSIFATLGTSVPVGGADTSAPPAVAPAPSAWEDEARQTILEREYEATDAGEGLQAPNRAHGLRTFFEPEGARVVGREDSAELARLRTVAVSGRAVGAGQVVAEGARVEVRRPGLVEWFENSERGLEQGWTVVERPGGPRASGPHAGGTPAVPGLSIDVAFETDVRVEGDRALVGGLEYGGLAAWDARGTTLPARMEAAGEGRLRIVVDDAAAVYPVTVDPTLTSPPYATLQSDQGGANLGTSIAGAGDVNADGYADVLVGARFYDVGETDEGAAFIFLGGPAGVASGSAATAATRLESDQVDAQFGASVAGAGDVNGDGYADVLVGAPNYTNGQQLEGAAFVFLGGASGIASGSPATAATVLEAGQESASMGFSVAGAGDVNADGYADVLVGASGYDAGETDEGAAFVFLGGASGVADGTPATAAATLEGNQPDAFAGASVAGAGDVNRDGYADVVVGAPLYDHTVADEGIALVYLGTQFGVSSAVATLLMGQQANVRFGSSVAGAGDTNADGYDDVVVGASSFTWFLANEGAAFVFLGGPSGIPNGAAFSAPTVLRGGQSGSDMGSSVAGAGDVNGDGYDDVVVGAVDFNAGEPFEGAAFVFLGGPAGVPSVAAANAAATLQVGQSLSLMGGSVAGAGDTNGDGYADVLVGASEYMDGQSEEGAAFVYQGGPYGMAGYPMPAAALEANQAGARFGTSVAGAGDVNGDGYADVVVGAPRYDAGQADEGAAFVFLGSPAGIVSAGAATAATLLQSDQADSEFGDSVAGAGDVNGDGYADVVVGASLYDAGESDEGAAFVFLGSASGVPSSSAADAAARLESDQQAALLGGSVAGAGDTNGDGFGDVVVGATDYDAGEANEGAAFVFLGSASGVADGTPAAAAAQLEADQASAAFGYTVASAGDTNGDGYADVVVGADHYDAGQANEGAAFVFLGSSSGIADGTPATAATQIESDLEGVFLGRSVAGAGDTNGDGYADVVVGLELYTAGQGDEGAAFVFLGSASGVADGTPATAAAQLEADQASANFGAAVAAAGDVNGDGYADVIVGAFNYDVATAGEGAAFVFLGSASGIADGSAPTAPVTLLRGQEGSLFSSSVAGAGDVNGDGRDDVVVGAVFFDGGQPGEGAAFVFMPGAQCFGLCSSESVGVYAPATGAWLLRQRNSSGPAQVLFTYGPGGSGLVAITGDWDGDGVDTPGLYDPGTGAFFLRNANAAGAADAVFTFGAGGRVFVPVAGDWDGDGDDTVGLYHPASGAFFLTNTNASGPADVVFTFGPGGLGWTPIAGDWDGDGDTTVGLYDRVEGVFYLRNENAPGGADLVFGYGPVTFNWVPIAGDYDGDGTDTIGLYSPSNGMFFLRNSNTPGPADTVFSYGAPNMVPLVGDWNGLVLRPGV